MIKNLTLFLICLISFQAMAQEQNPIPLIPAPSSLKIAGQPVNIGVGIDIMGDSIHYGTMSFLKDILDHSNLSAQIIPEQEAIRGRLPLSLQLDSTLNSEAYTLVVSQKEISLTAGSECGLVWAIQSLHQLLLLSKETINGEPTLPGVRIEDQPQFAHRGLLLDCCRHFFSVSTIKKYIDLLSFYKMNVLHWHLTEDQGWRVEIDAYPKLTEIGAWRTEEDGSRYGGFYTKDEIREVVAYAQTRGITIIPEIELPGHAQAALAAYPEYSCVGKNIEVVNDWGVFKEIYCAGNDSTFEFLETILDEVMELFPSEYIHIGGDEAPKFRWENCVKCKKRMADEHLEDAHALQSYFIKRIETHLNENGRILVGWDEILEGGLAPNAVLQSWRGMEHGLHAAEMGHKVIMSPTSHCYIDYGLNAIDLAKIYSFNPIPEALAIEKQNLIIGGECNMWTEHVPNDTVLDQRVFPRMIGLCSVLWEGESRQRFEGFYTDIQNHYPLLSSFGVQYGLEGIPAILEVMHEGDSSFVSLNPGVPNLILKYTYGENESLAYSKPFAINKSGELKVEAFKREQSYGEPMITELTLHEGLGKYVQYAFDYSNWYTAGGAYGLVDGLTGTMNFRDGHWQGFSGNDVDVQLDLGEKKKIAEVSANFYQYNNAWIFLPSTIEVYASTNGKKWVLQGTAQSDIAEAERGKHIFNAEITLHNKKKYRYIRLIAKNIKEVPDWHEAAGSEAWIFIDEIIVK